jgi:hypothetical protein
MPKESKESKSKHRETKPAEAVVPTPENGEAAAAAAPTGTKARTPIDDVIAAIETARDKVMADEVRGLTKLGIPRAMAYQMVAARFHQNVVTDGESGPEFENSHWNDR